MIDINRQIQKAKDFLELHNSSSLFILPCAWDAVSGKIFELEDFKAIGTTSAGIAATLGYPDGQKMSLTENIKVVQRIVDNTNIPVSADIEAGYASSIEGVTKAAEAVLNVGAVGLNLEDGTGDSSSPLFDKAFQQDKIKAIRGMSDIKGIHLFINARTDAYLVSDDNKINLRSAIDRGNAYKEAGADCIFIMDIGNLDKQAISTLVNEINAPINILAGANTPPIAELQDIGVSRLSVGPMPMRAVLSLLREIAKELVMTGTSNLMKNPSISYYEINNWFA